MHGDSTTEMSTDTHHRHNLILRTRLKKSAIRWAQAFVLLVGIFAFNHAMALVPNINTFPYKQDFESFATCGTGGAVPCPLSANWNNSGADDIDWTVDINGTSSSSTGPSADHTIGGLGGKYLYTESSSPANPNKTADLISPRFDFTALQNPELKFWSHLFGATMGTLRVDISTDGGASYTNIVAAFTRNLDSWQEHTVDLSAYTGQANVVFRFRGITGTSFTSDMAIDDFSIASAVPSSNSGDTARTTQNKIKNFKGKMARRIVGQIPDFSGLLSGFGVGGAGGASGINFSGNGELTNGNFGFDLRNFTNALASQAQQKDRTASGVYSEERENIHHGNDHILSNRASEEGLQNNSDGTYNPVLSSNAYQSDYNLWAKGTWVKAEEDRANTDERSDFYILHVGADYRYKSDLLIGVMAQIDQADEKSKVLGSKAESKGWMIGPYLVKRFDNGLTLDMHASYGHADNEISPVGTYVDDFDSKRYLLAGNLTGSIDKEKWHLAPSVGLVYFKEDQEAYTDSTGIRIGSQSSELGSINFGPKFTYKYKSNNGMMIRPSIGIKGIYDFRVPDLIDVNGQAVGIKKLRAQLKVGVSVVNQQGTTFSANYSYDGIGVSGYKAQSADVSFNTPISIGKNGATLSGSYSLMSAREIEYGEKDIPMDAQLQISIPIQ